MAQTTTIETVTITRPLKKGNRGMWDSSYMQKVKQCLKEGEISAVRPPAYYHFRRYYEILISDNKEYVIAKRKSSKDPIIYYLTLEEYYPKLLEAHVGSGHGGRDKMLHYIKNKWKIPRSAVELFPSLCDTCVRRRSDLKRGVTLRPTLQILPETFNSRGQVDLIDFQSCPDDDYKWLMSYQDQVTKFLHLRPLKSKEAKTVADELFKIFTTFGAPVILQSDSGEEFVADIIKEIAVAWPSCKILHGKPRNPESQENVVSTIADVEKILKARMATMETPDWARHCYMVQWQKNTSKHQKMKRTPYETLLGPMKCGVHTLSLPDDVLEDLVTEDDLERALDQLNEKCQNEPDVIIEDGAIGDEEMQELEPFAMEGIINSWLSRGDVQPTTDLKIKTDEVSEDASLTVQEAAPSQSVCVVDQDLKKCNCRATGKRCASKICSCFKAKVKCNPGCHQSTTCSNE